MTVAARGHAAEGTISHLDVLRCGIPNRPMSVKSGKPQNEQMLSAFPESRRGLECLLLSTRENEFS
jgi:hypothetical protein